MLNKSLHTLTWVICGFLSIQTVQADESSARAVAPDLATANLTSVTRWGRVDDITAYSLGVVACNIGNYPVTFQTNTPLHPVFTANMHRLKDGRFEQIGQSWVFHEYFALAQAYCATCVDPAPNGAHLNGGCSTTDSSSITGSPVRTGPRSEINAATGDFPFPFTAPDAEPTIGRRLQVHDADLEPALNAGALYFMEGIFITPDDAAVGLAVNNASYRRCVVSGTPPTFNVTFTATTQMESPAIQAWADNDPSVVITAADLPGDGRFLIAAKTTDLDGGRWHYEYAVQNLTSDRSGGSFSVSLPGDADVSNIGFHDVDSHSGEPYSLDDWIASLAPDNLTWSAEPFDRNENANALRWGTLYNFRFDAASPPASGPVTLGLFKPGVPSSMTAASVVPLVDCNGNGLHDANDIAGGGSSDGNGNGIPDECESSTVELMWAHSVAAHKIGGGQMAEFHVDLDLDGGPAQRTSEPRNSGLRILECQFSEDVASAALELRGPTGLCMGGCPMGLLPGDFGATSLARIDLGAPLPNAAAYTLVITASNGSGIERTWEVCAAALAGDFNNDGAVTAADKGAMLGFVFAPITQTSAAYDLQVNGGDSGTIEVSDIAAWSGFFGQSVAGQECP